MKEELEKFLNIVKEFDEKVYQEKKRQFEEAERSQEQMRLKLILEGCGMDLRIYNEAKNFKFDEFEYEVNGEKKKSSEIIESVREWFKYKKREKPFLILYGNYGTGKTKIAQKIAINVIEKRLGSVFYVEEKLLDSKFYEFDEVNNFIDEIKGVDYLIIDDFLTGHRTEYKMSMLFTILDYRYSRKLYTIITSNFDFLNSDNKQEITDFARLKDRLLEVGHFVKFDYPSRRVNAKVKKFQEENKNNKGFSNPFFK